jgi:hypothetical protein
LIILQTPPMDPNKSFYFSYYNPGSWFQNDRMDLIIYIYNIYTWFN